MRNCSDVTARLSHEKCSSSPVCGGGFGDIYQGEMEDGEQVAIKCPRLFVQDNDTGHNTLKASMLSRVQLVIQSHFEL
jgi:hypothetical protein